MNPRPETLKLIRSALTGSGTAAMIACGVYLFYPADHGIDQRTTGAVSKSEEAPRQLASVNMPEMPKADSVPITALKSGIEALNTGDIEQTLDIRDAMPEGSIDRQLLTWLAVTSNHDDVPASEIRSAIENLAQWPGISTMETNLERAMARDPLSLVRLRLTIGDEEPLTFEGAYALARTYQATGNNEKARALLIPYWHDAALRAGDERRIIEIFGDTLTKRDHEIRYFNMMVRDRIQSGGRIAPEIGYEDIHAAWSAVIRRNSDARERIDTLDDADRKTAAYAYIETEYARRTGSEDKAIEILSSVPQTAEFSINPDAWWNERRIISRQKFEDGDPQAAFDLVAKHEGGNNETVVDAAFHAGWYALRGLKKPALAVPYFEKIIETSEGNISKARGYYWLGRALEDEEAANDAFELAANFSTTFYGQLAAERIGRAPAMSGRPIAVKNADSEQFLAAVDRLNKIGETDLARKMYMALGWSENDTSLLGMAADHASQKGDYYAALKLAKAADWRGLDMGALTHPLGAISDATGLDGKDHALAYAVARQESEFNVGAVSSANAKGLLQLLPGTAKQMAAAQKMAYAPEKLTSDANYNARLGVAYLNRQLEQFGGSYILTFAAYNAGPRRADEWIERFGDPRGKPLDEVIDWIESISYPETRNYVQRLMENLQVYKTQLGQETSIVQDLQFGAKP